MSYQVTTAMVQQYSTNVAMLLQQRGSRLRRAVTEGSYVGKAASVVEQFGEVTAQRNASRHSDTPLISTPHDKRWVFPNDYDWADLIDQQDRLRLLVDPQGPYTMAGVNALGRGIDDEIVYGIFNANYSGENGTTSTGTLYAYGSNSQSVAGTTGAAAATGMNVSKLRAAMKKLLAAEVDIENDTAFVAMTATQHDNLLNEVQAISLEYQTRPVLENGMIRRFMGFEFIITERIPGGSGFNTALNTGISTGSSDGTYTTGSRWMCPFWVKSGVHLGAWDDITVEVDRRADKRYATQVYVKGTFGATRIEEKRCGIINCV